MVLKLAPYSQRELRGKEAQPWVFSCLPRWGMVGERRPGGSTSPWLDGECKIRGKERKSGTLFHLSSSSHLSNFCLPLSISSPPLPSDPLLLLSACSSTGLQYINIIQMNWEREGVFSDLGQRFSSAQSFWAAIWKKHKCYGGLT